MPFKSEKQRKYLYSQKPEVAAKYTQHKGSKGGKTKTGYKTK